MVIIQLQYCAKKGCTELWQDRHHAGCEGMWLNHFRHKSRSRKYKAFAERYYAFKEEDIVRLCRNHHGEIHRIYFRIIGSHAIRHGKFRHFSWQSANNLMRRLRAECYTWLTR